MKKLSTMLLILAMCFSFISATAIEIDFEAMTDEELADFISSANAEYNKRLTNGAPVTIKTSPDKYTQYVKNYVGLNLLSAGYTSAGGDRLDEYGSARVNLIPVTIDGTFIDIEDDAQLQQYVIVGQSIPANTEFKIGYKTHSDGSESVLIDFQGVESIDLLLKKTSGTEEDLNLYSFVPISVPSDRYTVYLSNYVGKNVASFGYGSVGGDRLEQYGKGHIKFNFVSDDGIYFDPNDTDLLKQYVVIDQDVPPNTEIKYTLMISSDGIELDHVTEATVDTVTLYVKKLAEFEGEVDSTDIELSESKSVDPDTPTSIDSNESISFDSWFDSGLGKLLPNPETLWGKTIILDPSLFMNESDGFYAQFSGVTSSEYEVYSKAVMDSGFNIDIISDSNLFYAKNSDGREITIGLLGSDLFITLS